MLGPPLILPIMDAGRHLSAKPAHAAALVLGAGAGALIGYLLPMLHSVEFVTHWVNIGRVRLGMFEYEFLGHVAGITGTIFLWTYLGLPVSLRFGAMYALALGITICTRAPEYHFLDVAVLLPVIAVFVVTLTVDGTVKVLPRIGAVRRWRSWSLPTRINTVVGLVSALGLLSWFGIQASDVLPYVNPPRPDVLRFAQFGHVIELHGSGGHSLDDPIYITGAHSGEDGVTAEYYWLRKYYPRHKRVAQMLMTLNRPNGERRYLDWLILIDWRGKEKDVFFDITAFSPPCRTYRALDRACKGHEFTDVQRAAAAKRDKSRLFAEGCVLFNDTPSHISTRMKRLCLNETNPPLR